ncbi:SIR2 family protein [Burkholderia vietnamiensis]|uniref:SIR2 family protein n=1 Tax=Burkholderia vietnamiensis TaxID=60552 RepID=UPI0008418ED5|nr:SIR2 family protein [Burkholderia vietnamiensis]
MNLTDQLEGHLKKFSSPPYLFVGSGIARRYLGLENWPGLLEKQCELHDLDFGFLNTTAKGDLPKLASEMAKEFHPKWWKDKKYKESRDQFSKLATSDESALKFEIAKYIGTAGTLTSQNNLLEELEIFKKIVVDGIVTTNWDGLLEALFSDYKVYIGQEELLFAQIQGIGEIYKIHGCFTRPDSLVLTSSDYDEFHRRNPYLASKLLTFFVENPIVFLGYSLTDKNILDIVHSILGCLSPKNVEKLADRLVFVQWDKNCTEDRFERTILANDGRTLPVYQVTTASMSSVLEALTKIKRKIPAKVLRMLKEQVFELVHTTSPNQRIFVQDIDSQTDFSKIEFAIGVGIQERLRDKGYTALSRHDIIHDVLFNDGGYRADLIACDTLPELLKKSKNTPIFKYLKGAQSTPKWDSAQLDERVRVASKATIDDFRPTGITNATAKLLASYTKDFDTYSKQTDLETIVNYAGMLPEKALKPAQLHKFLTENFELSKHKKPNIVTNFFKLVCIYDWMKFGK